MPIKPENRHRYGRDWDRISNAIRERAGHKCEWCDVAGGAWGYRDADGAFHELDRAFLIGRGFTKTPFFLDWPVVDSPRDQVKVISIILTVAHLDHVVENMAEDNLACLCQRCHLRYDAGHHAENALQTRRKTKAIGDLFQSDGRNFK